MCIMKSQFYDGKTKNFIDILGKTLKYIWERKKYFILLVNIGFHSISHYSSKSIIKSWSLAKQKEDLGSNQIKINPLAYWPGIFSCVVPIMENKTVKILIGAKLMLAKDKWGEESRINIVTLWRHKHFLFI